MWKTFKYSGRQRIAWIAPKGPAYQITDSGKLAPGFRSFLPERMEEVASADSLFGMIPEEVVEEYPELEHAK